MWFAWTYIWMGGREPVLSFFWAAAISSFFFFSSFCCCSFFFCKSLTFCASFCISFYNWESLQHHYWPTHTACYSKISYRVKKKYTMADLPLVCLSCLIHPWGVSGADPAVASSYPPASPNQKSWNTTSKSILTVYPNLCLQGNIQSQNLYLLM